MVDRGLLHADTITLKAGLESELWGYDSDL